MAKVIAVDPGHGWGKVCVGNEVLVFESVLGESKSQRIGPGYKQIETPEGHWLIGQSARKQSKRPITGADDSWPTSKYYRAIIWYGIAGLVKEQDQVTVDLGLTLAIRDYKRIKEQVIEGLIGEHAVIVDGKRKFRIIVKSVLPIPQGFGPASQYLGDDDYVVSVDLGTRNTNLATFDGSDIIFDLTDSDEHGAIDFLLNVRQRIADDFGREYHPLDLIERGVIEANKIQVGNRRIDVSQIIAEEKQTYFEAFRAKISTMYDTKKITKMPVFGGGDLLIGDLIADYYDQAIRLPNPQTVQVESVYNYLVGKN